MTLLPSEPTPTGPPSIQADLRGASSSNHKGFTIQRGADGKFEATRPMTGGVGIIRIKSDSEEGVKDIIDKQSAKIDLIEKTSIAAGKSLRATGADFETIDVLSKTSQSKRQYTSLQQAQTNEFARKSGKIDRYKGMKKMLENLQKMPQTINIAIFPRVPGIKKLNNYGNLEPALRQGLNDDHIKELAKGFKCSEDEIIKVFGQQPQSDVNAYITTKLAVLDSRIQKLTSAETRLKQLNTVGTHTLSTNPPTPMPSRRAASVSSPQSRTAASLLPDDEDEVPFLRGNVDRVPLELRNKFNGRDKCLFYFDSEKAMEDQIAFDRNSRNTNTGIGRERFYLSPGNTKDTWCLVKIIDRDTSNKYTKHFGNIDVIKDQLGQDAKKFGFGNPTDLIREKPSPASHVSLFDSDSDSDDEGTGSFEDLDSDVEGFE